MLKILIGAAAGGAAMWYWGDRIREMAPDTAHETRTRAARGLDSVQGTAGNVIDAAGETAAPAGR